MAESFPCPCDMCNCSNVTLNGEEEWCDECEMNNHEEDRLRDEAH
jgi:hypothetical protein